MPPQTIQALGHAQPHLPGEGLRVSELGYDAAAIANKTARGLARD